MAPQATVLQAPKKCLSGECFPKQTKRRQLKCENRSIYESFRIFSTETWQPKAHKSMWWYPVASFSGNFFSAIFKALFNKPRFLSCNQVVVWNLGNHHKDRSRKVYTYHACFFKLFDIDHRSIGDAITYHRMFSNCWIDHIYRNESSPEIKCVYMHIWL